MKVRSDMHLVRRFTRLAAVCGTVALAATLLPAATTAHDHREVADGRYTLVVGFLEEPAVAGEPNALSLTVEEHHAHAEDAGDEDHDDAGAPVEGLETSLEAEVIYGDQTMELELKPQYGKAGSYVAYFIPTTAGDYAFRVHGEIADTPIDETFAPSPEGMRPVAPREALEFPKPAPSSAA